MKMLSILLSLFIAITISQEVWAYDEADLQQLLNTKSCRKCKLDGADLSRTQLNRAILTRASLKNVNLTGANLNHAKLRGVDLTHADLSGVNLRGANLSTAILNEVDLRGAQLRGARLSRASLNNVNLTEVDLSEAELTKTNLHRANLKGADLHGAHLREVNFSGANLTTADLSGAILIDSDLSGAVITKAQLAQTLLCKTTLPDGDESECDLSEADLSGANLSQATLNGANLSGANLSGADLRGAQLLGADASRANLKEAELSDANLDDANFSGANLQGAILREADGQRIDFSEANLGSADLSLANLNGSDLSGAKLVNTNLENVTLVRAFLGKADFYGADLRNANFGETDLRGAMLSGFDLSGADFTRSNLSGANLSGAKLDGANLVRAYLPRANLENSLLVDTDLSEAYLYEANLVNADLRRSTLIGTKLTDADLSKANLLGTRFKVGYHGRDTSLEHSFQIRINEIVEYSTGFTTTSIHINGGKGYLTTKQGQLYLIENGKLSELLDLSNDPLFISGGESGLLGVTAKNGLIYLSYTLRHGEGPDINLIVDEYTVALEKKRNIVSIHFPTDWHHGGTITFDNFGRLYLSTGDGEGRDPDDVAQDLTSLRGKILRFNIEEENPQPEVVAFGLRNPWKFSIDSANRMFIGDVGGIWRESVYLLDDLYAKTPPNLGHREFEGTKRMFDDSIEFTSTLAPIFEYEHHREGRPISVIGGYYLDDFDIYLLGDLSGNIRFLKERGKNRWREVHFQKTPVNVTTFGYDSINKRAYMGGMKKVYELDMSGISKEQVEHLPWIIFCNTTMPDGAINDSGC
jgi:uncharacterized protein YjbI with pentapeptide repeats